MSQATNNHTVFAETPAAEYLSKYGTMRRNYLEEYQPNLYAELLRNGELKSHCLEIQQIAENRLKNMMKQFVAHNPPPNRNTDGIAWAAHMGMLKRSVEEIIFVELIYE